MSVGNSIRMGTSILNETRNALFDIKTEKLVCVLLFLSGVTRFIGVVNFATPARFKYALVLLVPNISLTLCNIN